MTKRPKGKKYCDASAILHSCNVLEYTCVIQIRICKDGVVYFLKPISTNCHLYVQEKTNAYLQEKKNSEVDEGDDDDRDQELEETGEYCVPAIHHFSIGSNTFCNLDKYILQLGQLYWAIWRNAFVCLDKYI